MEPVTITREDVTAGMGPALAYTIGVDIGQQVDPTAIAVVELRQRTNPHGPGEAIHITRYLERLPLGTTYPAIATRLAEIATNARQRARQEYLNERGQAPRDDWSYGFNVFVDATGVGRPVVDILSETGLNVTPVFFTHGDRRNVDREQITLGKAWLVSRLKTLFQTGRVRLPPNHPEAPAMIDELVNYEIRVDQNANDKYGAFRTGKHDDLVTALGLATQDEDIIGELESHAALGDYLRASGHPGYR